MYNLEIALEALDDSINQLGMVQEASIKDLFKKLKNRKRKIIQKSNESVHDIQDVLKTISSLAPIKIYKKYFGSVTENDFVIIENSDYKFELYFIQTGMDQKIDIRVKEIVSNLERKYNIKISTDENTFSSSVKKDPLYKELKNIIKIYDCEEILINFKEDGSIKNIKYFQNT